MEPRETPEIEKIVDTVVSILKQSDLEEATEQKVRTTAADKLGVDPSELSYKWIVRRCVEAYLLSLDDDEEEEGNKDKAQELLHQGGLKQGQKRKPNTLDEEEKVEPNQRPKQDGDQVICKISAIRISLSTEQWSAFRQRVPDIQDAITKLESRIRSKDARKHMETDMSNSAAALAQGLIPMEMKQIKEDINDLFDSPTASAPQGVIPMETEQVEADASNVSAPQEVIPLETKQVEADVSNAETKQVEADVSNAETKQVEADVSNAETKLVEADVSKAVGKQVEADRSNAETASAPHELVSMETKQIEAEKSKYVITSATKGVISMETKQIGSDITNSVTACVTQGVIPVEKNQTEADVSNAETTKIEGYISNSVTTTSPKGVVANRPKHTQADISYSAFAFGLPGLVPSKTTRLDGKNYYCWAHQMEIFLKRLKIAYVLTDRRPSIADRQKASFEEIARAKAEVQKWLNDDNLCHHSILSCLCDNLFAKYSKKTKSAKELWEELKSAYGEDFGTSTSKVNKYMQFEMVDGISILEQAQELCRIADSIKASGMWIDEHFHVSAIISKLPPSWKEYRRNLMREKYITVIMLMHRLRVEEESRIHAEKEGFAHVGESKEDNRLELEKGDFKRPAMHSEMEKGNKLITCFRCGQKGHIRMDARKNAYFTNLLQDGLILEDELSMEPQDEVGFTYAHQNAKKFTQASQTSAQMGSTSKKPQRGGNFTDEEDKLLVSAYLNISLDAVQGNDQKHLGEGDATFVDLERPPGNKGEKERLKKRKKAEISTSPLAGILTDIKEEQKKSE
ncbi:hypothetical protein RHGRI_001821 [Rhododendron griersonianum]|uniref:DEK-C domain-containing protein n=1 Tax=Rhododendron griersonianum TaxID=479676 RepID=A0AAV6LQK0_9ERIC|nr:hypothetical protein RHGRI_001821 [Rhododendron griersonianum]